MRLRPHRRKLVVWNQSADSAGRYNISPVTPFAGTRRIRAAARAVALIPVILLMQLERAVAGRGRVVLAGAVLTVTGLIIRGGPGGMVLLPGMMFLLYAPFMPGNPDARSKQRLKLKRELATYTSSAQRRDLEATLNRYPDRATGELRDILHNLAMTTYNSQIPGVRRQ